MEIIPFKELSPFPIVDLDFIDKPSDGFHVPLNNFCQKKYRNNSACAAFYKSLSVYREGFYACPFGFSAYKFRVSGKAFALTAFIPFPRQETQLEADRARDHAQTKTSRAAVEKTALALITASATAERGYQQEIQKYPAAFHELIKLNGAVKQHAELLLESWPEDGNVRTIFSSAEMMSRQFEILELIANQELTKLPVKNRSTLKLLVYKCLKIYETRASAKKIRFEKKLAEGDILVCNKTFPIIPFVLIDNAIRYSRENGRVLVEVVTERGSCELRVSNHCDFFVEAEKLFRKGSRGNEGEGSGNGLYLAQLVAAQHGAEIVFKQTPNKDVTFSIRLREITQPV